MSIEEVTTVTEEVVEAFVRLIPHLTETVSPPDRNALERIVASETTTLFVARVDGRVDGALALAIYRIPTGVRAWIEDVVVAPDARGRGIGQALVEQALQRAAEAGATTVDLTSRPSREAANRLYQRIGFEQRATNVYRYTLSVE